MWFVTASVQRTIMYNVRHTGGGLTELSNLTWIFEQYRLPWGYISKNPSSKRYLSRDKKYYLLDPENINDPDGSDSDFDDPVHDILMIYANLFDPHLNRLKAFTL